MNDLAAVSSRRLWRCSVQALSWTCLDRFNAVTRPEAGGVGVGPRVVAMLLMARGPHCPRQQGSHLTVAWCRR